MRFFDRLSYRTLQWSVAALALLHNLEEALTIPAYARQARERLAGRLPEALLGLTDDLGWLNLALAGATILPAMVVWVAATGQPGRGKAWAVVFVQSLFLANVFIPHLPAAIAMGGYAPGVVTDFMKPGAHRPAPWQPVNTARPALNNFGAGGQSSGT